MWYPLCRARQRRARGEGRPEAARSLAARSLGGASADEVGFALIDAIVALAVLMIVFLPAAMLMMETTTTTGDYRAKMVAESVASGILSQVRSAAANPSCLYQQSVMDLSPTAFWPMDDSGSGSPNVADVSGNGYGANAYNVPAWDQTPGPVSCDTSNGALAFNGSTTYVSTPVPSPTGTQLTVAAWFHLSGTPSDNPRIVANDHTDSDHHGFQLELNGSGSCDGSGPGGAGTGFFSVGNGTSQAGACFRYSTMPSLAGWYFYVGTYDGTSVDAYIDGALVGHSAYSGGDIAAPSCSCAVSIGYNPQYQGDYVPGQVADVAIWESAALSGSQIESLYQAASGTYTFPPQAPVALPKLWYATPSTVPFVSAGTWCAEYSTSPPVPCTPIIQKASGITFASYVTGGWCVLTSSNGSWQWGDGTLGSESDLGYFVAVKTTWGGGYLQSSPSQVTNISALQSVVESSPLAIPPDLAPGADAPGIGYDVGACPLGLS